METGFFPLIALLVGAALFALYWWVLRLKCPSRWAQAFIAIAMLMMAVVQIAAPVREVEAPDVAAGHSGTAAPLSSSREAVPLNPPDWGEAAHHDSPRPTPFPDKARLPVASSEGRGVAAQEMSMRQLFQDVAPLLGRFYLLGVVLVLFYFACQLVWLWSLCRRYRAERSDSVNIYHTDQLAPFSFGRNIFLRSTMDELTTRYVLMHELAHVRHRHFLKLCLLQLLTALCWYNPFAWLFFGEMRLQQEMEVDGDVLGQGVDREDYQLSLLRVCVSEGKWILLRTAYGLKPLKQRIIFMNTTMNKRNMRRREVAAVAALALVTTLALALGCQTREKSNVQAAAERHHPMRGCWTMDWISNTGSGVEVHPVAMHYGFYNDSTFLCFSYHARKGMNMHFSISGEGYTWHGDTLYSADGRPTDYTFTDERTALSRWMKDATQMAGVSGPDITEQWSRIKPDDNIVAAFRAAYTAQPHAERPLDGTWLIEDKDANGSSPTYLMVNDTVMVGLALHPSTVVDGFRYGGMGFIYTLRPLGNGHWKIGIDPSEEMVVEHIDADHVKMSFESYGENRLRRTETPAYLLRAMAPALMDTE